MVKFEAAEANILTLIPSIDQAPNTLGPTLPIMQHSSISLPGMPVSVKLHIPVGYKFVVSKPKPPEPQKTSYNCCHRLHRACRGEMLEILMWKCMHTIRIKGVPPIPFILFLGSVKVA